MSIVRDSLYFRRLRRELEHAGADEIRQLVDDLAGLHGTENLSSKPVLTGPEQFLRAFIDGWLPRAGPRIARVKSGILLRMAIMDCISTTSWLFWEHWNGKGILSRKNVAFSMLVDGQCLHKVPRRLRDEDIEALARMSSMLKTWKVLVRTARTHGKWEECVCMVPFDCEKALWILSSHEMFRKQSGGDTPGPWPVCVDPVQGTASWGYS